MSNIRDRALSSDNIARVYDNSDETDYRHNVIGDKTHKKKWYQQKPSRFSEKLRRGGADVIKAVGNSSPIYNNALRSEALTLLLAAQTVMTFSSLAQHSGGSIYLLAAKGLLEEIPHITGVRSRRVFLSINGFELIDHWATKYKRFVPYYNAFVHEKIRNKAKQYMVTRALGQDHMDIKETRELNEIIQKKVLKRDKTFKLQRIIQDKIRGKSYSDEQAIFTEQQRRYRDLLGQQSTTILGQQLLTTGFAPDAYTSTSISQGSSGLFTNIFGKSK